MPLDADHAWERDSVLSGAEIRAVIESEHPLEPLPREPHATARVYRFGDGKGTIGFVNPVSEPFCADCNRIRLTADGRLRTCLFSLQETDLRETMRNGGTRDRTIRGGEGPSNWSLPTETQTETCSAEQLPASLCSFQTRLNALDAAYITVRFDCQRSTEVTCEPGTLKVSGASGAARYRDFLDFERNGYVLRRSRHTRSSRLFQRSTRTSSR